MVTGRPLEGYNLITHALKGGGGGATREFPNF
jgi:hypothetical protein